MPGRKPRPRRVDRGLRLGTPHRRAAGPAHPPRPHPGDERRELPTQAQPGERRRASSGRIRQPISRARGSPHSPTSLQLACLFDTSPEQLARTFTLDINTLDIPQDSHFTWPSIRVQIRGRSVLNANSSLGGQVIESVEQGAAPTTQAVPQPSVVSEGIKGPTPGY